MIPNFIAKYPNIKSLRVDKLEADDLIAIISMHLEKTEPNNKVYLVSGDEDFLQLGRSNLYFVNYKKKVPFELTQTQAQLALHQKIVLGDKSDCIPSIFPKGTKFTKTLTKKEILESKSKLLEYLNLHPEFKKQYELNSQMIDFKFIPKTFSNHVIKLFDSI